MFPSNSQQKNLYNLHFPIIFSHDLWRIEFFPTTRAWLQECTGATGATLSNASKGTNVPSPATTSPGTAGATVGTQWWLAGRESSGFVRIVLVMFVYFCQFYVCFVLLSMLVVGMFFEKGRISKEKT